MMNKTYEKIKDGLWDFISSGLPSDTELDVLRKIVLLNLITVLGIFFLVLLSFVSFYQEDLILGAVNSTLVVFLSCLIYLLRKRKNYIVLGLVGTIVTGIFFLFLIAHGGIDRTTYLWMLTYPLIVMFLLGKHVGTYYSVIMLCLSGALFYLGLKVDFIQQYSFDLIIRLACVYATIYFFALVFEIVREQVQNRLKQSSQDLTISNRMLLSEIDERKRIEKALRNSEGFLDDVIESIQDGISVLDRDLTVQHTNSVMRQWYSQIPSLTGHKCHMRYRELDHPCDACPIIRCLASGNTEREIMRGMPGSSLEWLEVFGFPLRDKESGQITGAVELVRDITTPRRLERQLARAQKMEAIGTLAGGVAHDLNNILSGIVSYPELLLMDLPEDSPIRGPIATVQKSGKKAAAIVQDLLTLARRGVAVNEILNLNDTITVFFSSLEYSNIKKFHPGVSFELDLQPGVRNIIGSPIHLSKTIMNLCSNAAEAIEGQGVVRVATRTLEIDSPVDGYEKIPEGEYVVLSVTDSGSGISLEDINKIFEPFYTKKKMGRSGTGLGMAVVWGTVKDLQGYIDIESSPRAGTRIDLYLPATRQRLDQKDSSTPMHKYTGNEKILVVDDVEEQRDIASAMLKKIGYSVAAVPSGEEAVRYLKQTQVDIVILDMMMDPGMDGLETYREIIKLHPGQKAIIASGYSETTRVKEVQKLGAGAYVRKPYTLENLGISIRDELDK